LQRNETLKSNPEQVEHENSDYLFSEIDDASFEETMSLAIAEIMEKNRSTNDDESIEKAVSTEDIASAKSRGLVPKSGNWQKPKRWVRPEDADVPVDEEVKPRKKASEDVPTSNLTIDAMKAVFGDDFDISDLQDMYSIGLDGYSTNIVVLRGRGGESYTNTATATEGVARSFVEIEVEILDDGNYMDDEEYEKQPKGIDGHTPLVGTMDRTFTKDKDGNLSVSHNRFIVAQRFRGKGIASDISENVEKHYEKLGVGTITLNANADIGGYAWARQGYDFETEDEREEMQDVFNWHIEHMDILSVLEEDEFINQVDVFTHAWEFAEWNPTDEPHGQHLGKEIMLGTTWNAEKTLDKKSQGYQRGKIYFALKRKHNEQG